MYILTQSSTKNEESVADGPELCGEGLPSPPTRSPLTFAGLLAKIGKKMAAMEELATMVDAVVLAWSKVVSAWSNES